MLLLLLLLCLQIYYSYAVALGQLKLHLMLRGDINSMNSSFFHFCLGSKFFLSVSETTGLQVPALYIRDILCSVSTEEIKIVPLQDELQLPVLSVETLTYSEPKLFLSIIFYTRESQ
jgi:hypothetical protein